MNKIVSHERLNRDVVRMELENPPIAAKRRAGQFVVIRIDETGERIPLTLVDSDPGRGTITLVVQAVGATTRQLFQMSAGDSLLDVAGPLGHPAPIENYGTVIAVAGGVGAAEALPVIRALREAGNTVITIVGARSGELLILTEELRGASDELHICTDDGSLGKPGQVTSLLNWMINDGRIPDLVYAIGPVPMMRAVAEQTRPYGIRTLVSLNPLMVDGTGMCGCCRVTVGDQVRFACVDGPDFDAHQVDFDELVSRQRAYLTQEAEARKRAGDAR